MPMPTDEELIQLVKDLNELEALKAAPVPTSTGEARVAVEQPQGVFAKVAGMFFTQAKDPATERQKRISALERKINGMFDSIALELQAGSGGKDPQTLSAKFATGITTRIDRLFPGERRTGNMSMMAAAPKEGAKVFNAFCARVGAPTTLEEMSRKGPGMRGGA